MTDGTLALIEERHRKKAEGINTNELNTLFANIQASRRQDHNSYLRNICEEIIKHSLKHGSRDLYHKIGFQIIAI